MRPALEHLLSGGGGGAGEEMQTSEFKTSS